MKYKLLQILTTIPDVIIYFFADLINAIAPEETDTDIAYGEVAREILVAHDYESLETAMTNVFQLRLKFKARLSHEELTTRHNNLSKLWKKRKSKIDQQLFKQRTANLV